jgi:hypothetical protein
MMEALRSSKTSDFTSATRRHITEDGILQNCRFPQECFQEYRGLLFVTSWSPDAGGLSWVFIRQMSCRP